MPFGGKSEQPVALGRCLRTDASGPPTSGDNWALWSKKQYRSVFILPFSTEASEQNFRCAWRGRVRAQPRADLTPLRARAQGAALPAHLPAPLLYHVAADRLRNAWDDTRQPPPELRPARLCARPFPTRAYCVRARCLRPPRAVQTTLYVLPGFACLLIRTRLHTRQEMVRTPSGAPTRAPGRPARHPHSTAASQGRARVLFICGYSILVTFLMSCTATLYFLKTFFVRPAPHRRRRHARAPPHMRACTPTARRRPFLGPSPTRWSAMPRCSLSSHSCPSKRR